MTLLYLWTEVLNFESRAIERVGRGSHRRSSFRSHRSATVIFEIADAKFFQIVMVYPAHRYRRGRWITIIRPLHHFE